MVRLSLLCLALCGCGVAQSGPQARVMISQQDIVMNRPNTDRSEALFRMFADGTGTVDFTHGATGPQPVTWTLDRDLFCLAAENGLLASFGCARVDVSGGQITLAHIGSDSVVTGVFVARGPAT